ncbi:MAG: HEAT repeat domain-containing protein [Haloarculaceae archaeon]
MFDDGPERDTAFLYELARESKTSELVAHLRRGENPLIRRRAAETLGDLSDDPTHETEEEVIRALIKAVIEDDDDSVRARAIDALYRYGQDSFDRLVEDMTGFDAEDAPDRLTAKVLERWLDAEYPEFRMVAAAALGRIGNSDALPTLLDTLTDPNPRVRARAVQSCARIGGTNCVAKLQERLEDPALPVRRAAIRALGSIGTRGALKALVPVARTDEEELRRAAIEELGQFGSLEPVDVLLRAIEEDTNPVQRAAMFSLVRLFVEAPTDQSQRIRGTVAERLSDAEVGTVVPHLVDVVTESQREPVRRNALWLLGRVADPDGDHRDEVYDCLLDALAGPDEETAQFAAASLAELGSDELERRLHIFVETETTTDAAVERAEAVLEEIGGSPEDELVTNSVEYMYVSDPADYTEKKRAENEDGDGESSDGSGE